MVIWMDFNHFLDSYAILIKKKNQKNPVGKKPFFNINFYFGNHKPSFPRTNIKFPKIRKEQWFNFDKQSHSFLMSWNGQVECMRWQCSWVNLYVSVAVAVIVADIEFRWAWWLMLSVSSLYFFSFVLFGQCFPKKSPEIKPLSVNWNWYRLFVLFRAVSIAFNLHLNRM